MYIRRTDIGVTVCVLVCLILYDQVCPVAETGAVLGGCLDGVLMLLQPELVLV